MSHGKTIARILQAPDLIVMRSATLVPSWPSAGSRTPVLYPLLTPSTPQPTRYLGLRLKSASRGLMAPRKLAGRF